MERTLDNKGRWRNRAVSFRLSEEVRLVKVVARYLKRKKEAVMEHDKHGKVLKTELAATVEHAQVYIEGAQIPAKPNYVYTVSYEINVDVLEKTSAYQYGAITLIQEFQPDGMPGVVQPFAEHAIGSDTNGWKKVTYEYRTSAECDSLRM